MLPGGKCSDSKSPIATPLTAKGGHLKYTRTFSRMQDTTMSEGKYPNESEEYREARESLLKDEKELVEKR